MFTEIAILLADVLKIDILAGAFAGPHPAPAKRGFSGD
jgi:hypothetical protein